MHYTLVGGHHVRVQLLHYAQPQVVLSYRDVNNEQIMKLHSECGLYQGHEGPNGMYQSSQHFRHGSVHSKAALACHMTYSALMHKSYKWDRCSMVRWVGDLLG